MASSELNSKSAALYQRAQKTLPGGVSRNTVLRKPHPLYADHASGFRVTDIEGAEYIDFSNNMASLLHGHAHPKIVGAVTEQLQRGSAFMLATEIEVQYAEYLCDRCPSFEKLRFVNSGTEAVMGALKASRAFTGRPKIAKVEGAYHGLYDFAEISQTTTPEVWGSKDHPRSVPVAYGTPASALEEVIVIPFNDAARAIAILDQHKNEIAAILLDLMPHRVGLMKIEPEFLLALRKWADENGALLVFDEVVTFRSEFAGAQSWYDCQPDLTALGKAIGGGFPVGVIAGRAEVMDVMNPLADKVLFPHSGTFSANPVTLTAGMAAMELFDEVAVKRINALANRLVTGLESAIEKTGIKACVTGGGSMFRVHFKEHSPRNYRETYATAEENRMVNLQLDHMFASGFLMINTCAGVLSTPMAETEIDAFVAAMEAGFRKL
ncbi:MAG: aspartate aminotransferase family protein [Planctomycetes bacterium]|jgi:glutamate-1-semialdehyde 2,1-aminomutase|nr:aspartate aminotransferase family protein [Planctomycetota bacterium]MBT4029204.1 aspartate aminotransferase family protein [Planctomycetota bacterium]MBT4559285.1 aspartate aminotransferase family protein [Planctomycetota bacterium]MBT5102003.1 aspartate aminotransferase family protein [Planctomycetota bacterium]MBT5119728.1 aspartate aminotransferase family protein [Planctomycetota bacterium]